MGDRPPTQDEEEPTTSRGSGDEGSADFVPIGVWVCNWADIFPWLATGYCNSIDDTTSAEIMVKFQMMVQDFLTLNRLYRYAASVKMVIPGEPAFQDGDYYVDEAGEQLGRVCLQIADSFASAYASLADAKPAGPADYKSAAVTAHNNFLGKEAKKIYEIWDQTPCLRGAELGLGYIMDGRSLQTRRQFNLGRDDDVFSQWVPMSEISYYEDGQCTFDGSNFSAFAQFYKVLPLILPQSGKIIAFGEGGFIGTGKLRAWIGGGYAGYMGEEVSTYPDIVKTALSEGNAFSRGGHREFKTDSHRGIPSLRVVTDTAPIEFNFVEKSNYLESAIGILKNPFGRALGRAMENAARVIAHLEPLPDDQPATIKLYPIPLSAARNINWTGQSFSTNVKADVELNNRLEKIVQELQRSNVTWSWSSDQLSPDWDGEAPYLPTALRKEYFGLAKTPPMKP
jgi:hypothetical protein